MDVCTDRQGHLQETEERLKPAQVRPEPMRAVLSLSKGSAHTITVGE